MVETLRLPNEHQNVEADLRPHSTIGRIAYLVTWHFEYDLPKYDLPSEIRTHGFLIGYVSVLVFCWPIDDPYLGNSQEVNLLPDRSPSFQQSLVQQHVWASGPMEHQGAWVAQKDDGYGGCM